MRRYGIAIGVAAAIPAAGADAGDPSATWVPDGPVNAVAVEGSTA